MPSITDQINKYQSAAHGPKNVGSQPSREQMRNAQNTSIGRTRATISKRSTQSISQPVTGSGFKPSLEGYMQAPSTLIGGTHAGYSNPASQKARFKTKGIQISSSTEALKGFRSTHTNIKDYRNVGFAENSIKKLSSIMRKRLL